MGWSDWFRTTVRIRTLLLIAATAGAAGLVFVLAGGVPIAADIPHSWLTNNVLHFVFKRSIASRAYQAIVPADIAADSRVKIGAQHFDMVCANCHGGPGIGQSVTALSMTPRPQNLPTVVGQYSDAELFQIVMHGVKFSAMPSWATSGRDDEVWSMVAFLRALPKMDSQTYFALTTSPPIAMDTPSITLDPALQLRPADARNNTYPKDEFLYAAPAIGFGDREIRSHPIATCARCHGTDGTGAVTSGEAPNLTLQDSSYLKTALLAFSSGARHSGFMQGVASQLSERQIEALAEHFAGMPPRSMAPTPSPDLQRIAKGRAIAEQGVRVNGIPACSNCHDGPGAAVSQAPRIAGQSEIYLIRQLGAFRNGGRGTTHRWNPMPAEAGGLDNTDIANLAAFYASLAPTKGRAGPPPVKPLTQEGNAVAGSALFETRCVKCHLNEGRGEREGLIPNLTIHSASYVSGMLDRFRAGQRPSTKMREEAQALDEAERANVAAYVASLPAREAMLRPDAAAAARGQSIATRCTGCHSAAGITALALVPRLQGQSSAYLKRRLDSFADTDGDMSLGPMGDISRSLSEAQRRDVAAYFASLPPLAK